MRIPTNSNFSREIAKRFETIFHREMSLGGLQDLQEQLDLINPVDTHLLNQVSQLKEKANGQETSKVANAVRQVHNERKDLLQKLLAIKEKKKVTAWKLHQIKYHQVTL